MLTDVSSRYLQLAEGRFSWDTRYSVEGKCRDCGTRGAWLKHVLHKQEGAER
jgi:hypothetical protein